MKILIPYESIEYRVREMAHIINKDYLHENITVICVLRGAVMFFSDLVKHIESPIKYEFLQVSTYGDSEQPEQTPIVDLIDINPQNIMNQNVLIVEDVIDTGNTLKEVVRVIDTFFPKTLRVCALVDKTREGINFGNINVKNLRLYLGFRIDPDVFIIGYGMDNNELMRNQMDITAKQPCKEHITVEKLNGSKTQWIL